MGLFNRTNCLITCLTGVLLLASGCGDQPKQDEEYAKQDAALAALAGNLKSIDDEFVPESISDESPEALAKPGGVLSKAQEDDICGDLDFMECQPRLLRFYVRTARLMFGFSHLIVRDVARGLGHLPDGSTGTMHIEKDNVTVQYRKTSFLNFELLLKQADRPVGFIKVEEGHYELRFDIAILEQDNPQSKGGKIAVDVTFKNRESWQTEIQISDTLCDPADADDPEAAYLRVGRDNGLWKGVTMFYNGAAASFEEEITCETPRNDQNGLVIYTDFVANRRAAKAAMYFMRRNETDTQNISEFGLNGFCGHYADLCQSLGVALGLPVDTAGQQVATHLSQFGNPYCAQRGSRDITWNDDCSAVSNEVSAAPLQDGSDWMAPSEFYQMSVPIPETVN